jgi:hypothetical protein
MTNTLMSWTSEQILTLAPDAQVSKAAQRLARAGKWQALGNDGRALWGEQQGSGSKPYQVAVDLTGPAFKCNCPSRKHPCKHAIGLFLLAEAAPEALPESGPPKWVRKWLDGRAGAVAKQARPASEPVADPAAQARRAARREKRVEQGVAALTHWLDDLVRQGFGNVSGQPPSFWETQAARLVDAQAPGLARRVRDLAGVPLSGEGWPARMLDRLARLHVLLEAFQRLDRLPPDLQAGIRTQIGWSQDQNELRGQPGEWDRWIVVGQRLIDEDQLRIQRTWLWEGVSHRAALILDFAAPGQAFEVGPAPGTAFEAELVFWQSPFPQRALVKSRTQAHPIKALPGYPSLRAALTNYGAALARMPWLERFLVPLEGVVPIRQGEGWAVIDSEECLLPLALPSVEGWRLMALSGGHPLTLVAEWNGEYLSPLSAWTGGELILMGDTL